MAADAMSRVAKVRMFVILFIVVASLFPYNFLGRTITFTDRLNAIQTLADDAYDFHLDGLDLR